MLALDAARVANPLATALKTLLLSPRDSITVPLRVSTLLDEALTSLVSAVRDLTDVVIPASST